MSKHPDHEIDLSTWRRFGPFSRLVVMMLAGAVLWLFMMASQHHHASDAEDADCAICTAVVHHVVDLTAPPSIAPPLVAVIYFLAPFAEPLTVSAFKAVCPPICGPPSLV